MDKRSVVRLELLLLGGLLLLLLYRAVSGPPAPDGLAVLVDLEPQELQHAAFVMEWPAEVRLEATGSLDQRAARRTSSSSLAAYGWLVRRADRAVVWQMDAAGGERGRGALVTVRDTLALQPGIYDAYFTSYGDAFYDRDGRQRTDDARWTRDARAWRFLVQAVGAPERAPGSAMEDEAAAARAPHLEGQAWAAAPLGSNRTAQQLLEVQQPVQVRLYAVGEFHSTQDDYGWIQAVPSGERVWEMTQENTEPAGGVAANRRFDGQVMLGPGLYEAHFQTDRTHAFDDWRGNPPLDPAGWGLTLAAADPADAAAIGPFDPWAAREPLVRLTRVTDDAHRSAQFAVAEPLDVVVYAVGELSGSSLYDYGWIEKNDEAKEQVWKMSWDASQPAGGDEDNRLETAFVHLEPGTYTVHYQTDGSHAYEDWRKDAPDHPERWGVTLFPLAASVDSSAFELLATPTAPQVPAPPHPHAGAGQVLGQVQLGNESRVRIPFRVEAPITYHVEALGEISFSGRYDYGWIEQADTGSIVWEMTWQNTEPAGGDDKNRRFEGDVVLAPGRYVLHYRTDMSHAYDDFGDRAPDDPAAWGIMLQPVAP